MALLAVAIGPVFAQDGGPPSEPGNLVQQLEDLKAQVDANSPILLRISSDLSGIPPS